MMDTAEKRRSASGVGFLPFLPGVTPNASHGQEWRQEAGWMYSGILAGIAIVIPRSCFHLNFVRTTYYLDFLRRTTHELDFIRQTEYDLTLGCEDDTDV